MSALGKVAPMVAEERGGVLVMFALFAPVLILFMAFVLDVGNWFEHKRHLQLQADAGALAAAQEFQPCVNGSIIAKAQQYSGVGASPYNLQIGNTSQSNIQELINSRTYYNQSSPVDGTVNTAAPCTAEMVDVKLTETDLPWYFQALNVPFLNAHARVEIHQKDSGSGSLPVAVNDTNPRSARAYFIDESNGTVIASTPLTRTGANGGFAVWSNASAPLAVNVNKPNIGVRIAISGSTTDTTCGDSLVNCFDPSTTVGALHIQGWTGNGTGTATAPIARGVTLFPGTCSDAYFSNLTSTCTVGVKAKVDFGGTTPPAGAQVKAVVAGSSYTLTYDSSSDLWSTASGNYIPLSAAVGSIQVDLNAKDTAMGNNSVTFTAVQRSFTASATHSGPIQVAGISESGVGGANSFRMCETGYSACDHNLVVTIGISGNLQDAQGVGDPLVSLRVAGNGSQTQALDCDPNRSTLKDQLALGCSPVFVKNTGTTCPANSSALFGSPEPWQCVGIKTGTAVNDVPAGMNQRILGNQKASSCTSPSHWNQYPNLPKGDPRIVDVFLTPYGTFTGNGQTTVPVIGFATFYVTGYAGQGNGFASPCQPPGGTDDPAQPGFIVGHFIKYVDTLNTGGGGSMCDPNAFGTCVAVLTQ
jgi:Flp pilus assembly protein TadG